MKLSSVLLILITLSCTTIEYVYPDYILPPEPEREKIVKPVDKKDYINILLYYEKLVQEWENWASSVKKIILHPKKDS